MKLSIIINHHRTPNILKMCLDSLKKELTGADFDYEIIIADSETDEITLGMLEQRHPDVLFIGDPKNIGFSKSVNPAIKKSKGEFILSINADIIIKNKKSIKNMMDYFNKNPNTGLVGPKLLNIDGSVQHTYFREYTPLTVLARRTKFGKTFLGKRIIDKFTYQDREIRGPTEVEWLMGSALMIKRAWLEKIGGGFDDRFFMYFEDVDLCRRFRSAGYKIIYFPQAIFTHYHIRQSHGGRGIFDIFKNWLTRVHIKSYFKYLWKWHIEMPIKNFYNKINT